MSTSRRRLSAGIVGAVLGAVVFLFGTTAFRQDPRSGTQVENLHADPRAGIDGSNVANLRLAWKVDMKAPMTHRPIVSEGRVFVADWSGEVTAVDALSGREIWRKAVEQPKADWPWHGFAGTGAVGEGLLFEASAEGNVFALDVRTGDLRWKAELLAGEDYAGNCGALLYHDGLVYVGASSVEEGIALQKGFEPKFRGAVVAFEAATGREAWKVRLTEPPANGVAVWGSFALDPETKTLFFGTGNNYTGQATQHSDAILALDAKGGQIRWSRQITANDVWTMKDRVGPDYDFAAGPQLFEGKGERGPRKLVGCGQKSGVYHALDRGNGEIVWQAVVGYGEIAGGIMADASVGEGRVFVWANNSFDPAKRKAADAPMNVKALDASTGAIAWTAAEAAPAGVTSAGFLARDVYLVPSLDGKVRAFASKDGKLLWTSREEGSSIGTSLTVHGGALYFGRGVPEMFGGQGRGDYGLYAYTVSK